MAEQIQCGIFPASIAGRGQLGRRKERFAFDLSVLMVMLKASNSHGMSLEAATSMFVDNWHFACSLQEQNLDVPSAATARWRERADVCLTALRVMLWSVREHISMSQSSQPSARFKCWACEGPETVESAHWERTKFIRRLCCDAWFKCGLKREGGLRRGFFNEKTGIVGEPTEEFCEHVGVSSDKREDGTRVNNGCGDATHDALVEKRNGGMPIAGVMGWSCPHSLLQKVVNLARGEKRAYVLEGATHLVGEMRELQESNDTTEDVSVWVGGKQRKLQRCQRKMSFQHDVSCQVF